MEHYSLRNNILGIVYLNEANCLNEGVKLGVHATT